MSRRSILMEALLATPRDLARTLRRVDDAQAQRITSPEQVSITGIMEHLCEHEVQTLARWRHVIADAPDTGATPGAGEQATTLPELVKAFTTHRTATLAFLGSLQQPDWGILIEHEGVSLRLREDVQALVTHDNEQLNLILEQRDD